MFVVDRKTSFIDYSDKKLLSLLRSSNQPYLAAADRPAEPTEAYICSFQNAGGNVETYIMLHLIKSKIRVFYKSDKGEFTPEEFNEVESDALEFLESMGFMMDSVVFQKMKDPQRKELFEGLAVFIRPEELPGEEREEELVSVAELGEGLEDVFSEDDLAQMEVKAGKEEPLDLMDNFDKAFESMDIDSTKADLAVLEPKENEKEKIPVPKGGEMIEETPLEGLGRLARIMSSF